MKTRIALLLVLALLIMSSGCANRIGRTRARLLSCSRGEGFSLLDFEQDGTDAVMGSNQTVQQTGVLFNERTENQAGHTTTRELTRREMPAENIGSLLEKLGFNGK